MQASGLGDSGEARQTVGDDIGAGLERGACELSDRKAAEGFDGPKDDLIWLATWGPQIPPLIANGTLPADVPPDFGYVTDAAQKAAQEKLASLVPDARHITKTNSGHEIHKEQPQLVIDAIVDVVNAVRDPASWAGGEAGKAGASAPATETGPRR